MNTTKCLLAYLEKVGTITSTFHLKSTTLSDRDLTLVKDERKKKKAVSYTHLTLPTNHRV